MPKTIQDVAEIVGCSVGTVSRAINNRKGVSEKTRKKIFSVMDEMGYSPNAIARSLALKKSRSIAFIVPDISNPFFGKVAFSVDEEMSKHGYNTILCNTGWDEKTQMDKVMFAREQRAAGIIIKPATDDIRFLDKMDIPFVLISHTDKSNISYVDIENDTAGYIGTEHLLECGYQNIAFLGGYQNTNLVQMRKEGYCRALQEKGRAVQDELILYGQYSIKSGYRNMDKLMQLPERPDAIICCDDVIALGAWQRASELGLSVPDDLGIIGFNDSESASLPQVGLTTISQPKDYMGQLAANTLVRLIKEGDDAKPQKTLLYPELIVRNTTRK